MNAEGKSDHNLVFLQPQYKLLVLRQPTTTRSFRVWSPEAEEALKDCYDTTDWSVLLHPHGEDIEEVTHCVTDYLNFCMDVAVPTKTVRCFPNNKLWITSDVKDLLNQKKRAFKDGNWTELKHVQGELKVRLKEAKESYRKKVERKLQDNNMKEVWGAMKNITGCKNNSGSSVDGGVDRANQLNNFYNRAHSHLDKGGGAVRVMFFDFSSAFNTIQPLLLRDKLMKMKVDMHLVTWIIDYLIGRPQHVRIRYCSSDTVISSTGAPQGTVLSPVLFTLYTSDFKYNSELCHMQKFSDDTAIVGCVRNGQEYRLSLVEDFVEWCNTNHLKLNITKTKEMCIDFRRSRPSQQPISIKGVDVEVVRSYKYLGVHLDEMLDWICQKLLLMSYQSMVASVLFYAVVCWGGSISNRDSGRLDRLHDHQAEELIQWQTAVPVLLHRQTQKVFCPSGHKTVQLLSVQQMKNSGHSFLPGVQECDQMGSVVGAKGSMVMDDAVVGNSCTHCDVPSALDRDFNNGTLGDDIPSPPSSFCEVESNLIDEDELVLLLVKTLTGS
ncbi:hypothetical protein NFI96_008261 [Prochilodus magdalenae]|nr:hypothetical protein NFI96_008261 [Prochilodus magdalenae]